MKPLTSQQFIALCQWQVALNRKYKDADGVRFWQAELKKARKEAKNV